MNPVHKSIFTILVLVAAATGLSYALGSCNKEQNTDGITLIQQEIPEGFPAPAYQFADNPLSKEGFELGRKLFYDGRLSIDNLHPCSSCHQQIGGFGTFEHDRSHGVFDSHTSRNAPVLFNLAWNKRFHWDGAFTSLTDAIAQPINGHIEMGETYEGIINKIKDDKDCAMVVLGKSKTSLSDNTVLPIISRRIGNQIKVPVVVVPENMDENYLKRLV